MPAQRIFAQNGYRPVVKQAQRVHVPVRPNLFSTSTSGLGTGRQALLRPEDRDRHEDPEAQGRELSPVRPGRDSSQAGGGGNPGAALGMGLATAYLSVIVLLPLAALIWYSAQDGRTGFWDAVTEPQSVAALKLTLVASAVVVLIMR